MSYDLVIKNGTVVDGSGLPRYRADVGVRHGRIVTIGRIRERAREVVDAEGQVVAPGFVDGHTHMDAQIFWDPLGTSSCWHGITSVVMGNCGFTLAPCAKENKHLVVRNLQRAEDIPPAAMEAGIEWRWTTFPEFLDCLDSLPKGINYGGYVGHSAVRTYVMGERAFEQAASEDDLKAMEREVRDAIRAGAIGFTTSRSPAHETPDGRRVASRMATWDEVRRLVGVMGELNAGLFEIAGEGVDRAPNDPGLRDYHVRRERRPPPARHRGGARRLRSAPRLRYRRGTASHGRRGRPRARSASGRDHDRPRTGEGSRSLLPAAGRQRGPGRSPRADASPAGGGHLLRFGRARLAAHGLVAPDPPALSLGAPQASLHPRAGRADADAGAGDALGLCRPRAHSRGDGRRLRRLRSGDHRRRDAGGRGRPAGRRAPPRAAHPRHRRDDRQRRGPPARRQAHRGASGSAAARAGRTEGVSGAMLIVDAQIHLWA